MIGRRLHPSSAYDGLAPDQHGLVQRVRGHAWIGAVLFVVAFALLDVGLLILISDSAARLAVRWLLIGGVCVLLTVTLSRRTLKVVTQAMSGERAARDEAEALADLVATVASGEGINDILNAAVGASASLFGDRVRCSVGLPDSEGVIRLVAWSHESAAPLKSFGFRPGEGFNGRAFSEGRLIRVDDVKTDPSRRPEISRVSDVRTLMVAPLMADRRTLGILSAVSPAVGAFGEREERILTAIARHVAVALVAAEARETALREATKKAAVIDQMADAVLVADRNLALVEFNQAAATLLDIPADDLIGLGRPNVPWQILDMAGNEISRGQGPLNRAVNGEVIAAEYRILTHTGHERSVWATATPLRGSDGELNGGILVLRDMADWKRAENALRESEERYRRLVELCPDPILVHCDGKVVYANPATVELAGATTAEDLLGRSVLDFVPLELRAGVVERTQTTLETGEGSGMHESPLVRLDGELIHVESTSIPIMYEGRPAIQAVLRDVTERRRAEAELAHQAMHDALTGLPNRVLLLDRLQQAIAVAQRDGVGLSLLLMDLDRFKEVNDTLGHHAGDLLLQQVGTRLRGALRQVDTIARLGGDEFAVILPGTDADCLPALVGDLLRRLQAPFTVEGQHVAVGASIGVTLAPEHGTVADTLLRRADVAMYVAKRSGAGFAIYSADQDRNSPDRLSLIGELRRAVEDGELVLHYQPKIDLRTGALAGVEALVRWEHPIRGLLSPDQFVPIAEQAGLIEPLSLWVLRAALMQANAWRRIGMEVPVAANLSMRSLHDEDLPDKIAELLQVTRTPANLLVLEITESTLMADPNRTLAILERLRAMNVRVAIDDFGTGHSSLTYLKRLLVDELKIDRSFVKDIVTDATDRIIVRSTIDLAHGLGLRVVAEGVEDAITQALLADLGCDEAQGFHIGRPLRGYDLTHWLCEQAAAA
jgi:diguanylate cyclase (GGDEF)-like protein/PAS domain S-box-containing protein